MLFVRISWHHAILNIVNAQKIQYVLMTSQIKKAVMCDVPDLTEVHLIANKLVITMHPILLQLFLILNDTLIVNVTHVKGHIDEPDFDF